ncbi:MAG: PQQ-binding-like beta-propeller repeat protein [bacterium]|nr:PQQ-binding-like beta-propeller repeat protein [bacterium]
MTTNAPVAEARSLRLWPGVAVVLLQWLVRLGLPVVAPDVGAFAVLAGPVGLLAVVLWWVLFSRAAWVERIGAVAAMGAALFATPYLLHESVRQGNMGVQFLIYSPSLLSLGFVAWAVITRNQTDRLRRVTMVATILLACGGYALFRSEGLSGEGAPRFAWRWSATAEERLLARADDEPAAPAAAPATAQTPAAWPGFRGPDRDGGISGVRIAADWSTSPPVELWRRPVGPGVSSFAVHGGLAYTQEQRGDDELVSAYRVATGEPVWRHRDAVRFWDAHVGAGPRATPAVGHGRVYTLGATGIVNALDAASGAVIWSRDGAADAGSQEPEFGFTSSPLVVGDLVIIALRGRLVGYDAATGEPRWYGPERGGSYSSPHLLTVGGIEQVVLLDGSGAAAVALDDGGVLWEHSWPGYSYVQPAVTADGDLLIGSIEAMPANTLRLKVSRGPDGWTVEERWSSRGLKPHFSGFVVHDGHAYGFDGRILACIDVATGERRWKGGRYGHGQLLLLRDQGLLLVLTERGELALVQASPGGFSELGLVRAIAGRTWNYPALAGDVVLVRNGEEMAAFRLATGG